MTIQIQIILSLINSLCNKVDSADSENALLPPLNVSCYFCNFKHKQSLVILLCLEDMFRLLGHTKVLVLSHLLHTLHIG